MKIYKVSWKNIRYGESKVHANSKREAREKAKEEEDYDFEEFDPCGDWEIDKIEEIKEA